MLPFTSTLFTLVAFAVTLHGTYASYVPTCQDEYLSGDTLNAQCRNEAGQYVSTSLGLDDCVANYGGQLTCVHGNGGFSASCNVASCVLTGGEYMECQCNGNPQGSGSIVDLGACIDNQNGVLAC